MAGKGIVRVSMKPTSEGGRRDPFTEGYRPHIVADRTSNWLGVQVSTCATPVAPGETAEVSLDLIFPGVDYSALGPGAKFRVMEGPNTVGEGVVLERLEE